MSALEATKLRTVRLFSSSMLGVYILSLFKHNANNALKLLLTVITRSLNDVMFTVCSLESKQRQHLIIVGGFCNVIRSLMI